VAFSRDAILLAQRLPLLPAGGDEAQDMQVITDPISGLSFRISVYRGYHQVRIEISSAWGTAYIGTREVPGHSVVLFG
jgi:hypothetical protein